MERSGYQHAVHDDVGKAHIIGTNGKRSDIGFLGIGPVVDLAVESRESVARAHLLLEIDTRVVRVPVDEIAHVSSADAAGVGARHPSSQAGCKTVAEGDVSFLDRPFGFLLDY